LTRALFLFYIRISDLLDQKGIKEIILTETNTRATFVVRILLFALLVSAIMASLVSMSGCITPKNDEENEKIQGFTSFTNRFNFNTQQSLVYDPERTLNIQSIPFISAKAHPALIETEVKQLLINELESGKYNVVAIETTYRNGQLFSANILYDVRGNGLGNDLRIFLPTVKRSKTFPRDFGRAQKVLKRKMREDVVLKAMRVVGIGSHRRLQVYYVVSHE